jgi:hypothetical protein
MVSILSGVLTIEGIITMKLMCPMNGPFPHFVNGGTLAERLLEERHPRLQFKDSTLVLMCFAGLSMGDHWAPCIAQASYPNLLRAFDVVKDEEIFEFGRPLPRSPLGRYAVVCIDDRLNMLLVLRILMLNLGTPRLASKLIQHTRQQGYHSIPKSANDTLQFLALGELKLGWLGMKRERLCALSWASMHAANGKLVTRAVLDSLLGSWAFAFWLEWTCTTLACNLNHNHCHNFGGAMVVNVL